MSNHIHPLDQAVPLLNTEPRKSKASVYQQKCIQMHIARSNEYNRIKLGGKNKMWH